MEQQVSKTSAPSLLEINPNEKVSKNVQLFLLEVIKSRIVATMNAQVPNSALV